MINFKPFPKRRKDGVEPNGHQRHRTEVALRQRKKLLNAGDREHARYLMSHVSELEEEINQIEASIYSNQFEGDKIKGIGDIDELMRWKPTVWYALDKKMQRYAMIGLFSLIAMATGVAGYAKFGDKAVKPEQMTIGQLSEWKLKQDLSSYDLGSLYKKAQSSNISRSEIDQILMEQILEQRYAQTVSEVEGQVYLSRIERYPEKIEVIGEQELFVETIDIAIARKKVKKFEGHINEFQLDNEDIIFKPRKLAVGLIRFEGDYLVQIQITTPNDYPDFRWDGEYRKNDVEKSIKESRSIYSRDGLYLQLDIPLNANGRLSVQKRAVRYSIKIDPDQRASDTIDFKQLVNSATDIGDLDLSRAKVTISNINSLTQPLQKSEE